MKKYLLKLLLFFVIFTLVVVLAFVVVGYSAQGKEGAVNAAQMGLLISVMALPFMGIFIATKFWSGYAGRWGEYNYKKELEGDPNDRSKQKDKW
ncbi:MAG: hypothetical protein WA116_02945 [Anaerolineaceae bacterium]